MSILAIIVSELSGNSLSQAQKMIQEGKYENAVELLKKKLIKAPQNIQILTLLGDCHTELKEYDIAIRHYIKVQSLDTLLTTKKQINLNNSIAYLYRESKQYEKLFETYLQILRINPEDLQANKGVAYGLLGMKQFNLSIPYFEKIYNMKQNNDIKDIIGYYTALSYGDQTKKAKEIIVEILEKYPDNMHLQLLFIVIFQEESFRDGILYIQKIFHKTNDAGVMRVLIKLYSYFLYSLDPDPKLIGFMKQNMENKDYPKKLRREAHYFYLFFLIKLGRSSLKEMREEIKYFEKTYENYRNLDTLKNTIGIENENFDETIPFENLYQKEMESIIPDDFLFNLSGLRINYVINIEKFFDFSDESAIQLREEFRRPNIQSLLDQYYALSGELFLRFTERATRLMGLKIINSLRNRSDDHIFTYSCKEETSQKTVIACFAQCKKSAYLSDIFLDELIAKSKANKARKIILVSNGNLTKAAKSMSKMIPEFAAIKDDELYDLLLNGLPSH